MNVSKSSRRICLKIRQDGEGVEGYLLFKCQRLDFRDLRDI